IRDRNVTGVQTCALPISRGRRDGAGGDGSRGEGGGPGADQRATGGVQLHASQSRRGAQTHQSGDEIRMTNDEGGPNSRNRRVDSGAQHNPGRSAEFIPLPQASDRAGGMNSALLLESAALLVHLTFGVWNSFVI